MTKTSTLRSFISEEKRFGLYCNNGGQTAALGRKFVALVLNRNITQKIKIILFNMLSRVQNCFHLPMHFGVIKQVYVFIAQSIKVIPTVITSCSINTSKNQDRIIFQEF